MSSQHPPAKFQKADDLQVILNLFILTFAMLDKLQHVTERRNKVYMFLKFDRPDWLKY